MTRTSVSSAERRWPEAAANESLYEYLSQMDAGTVARMKSNVDANACWFDWFACRHRTERGIT